MGLYRKSYFIFVLQVFPQKSQLDMKIAVWFLWIYQFFRKTSTIIIVVTNNVSNVASNYDVKMLEMKYFTRWIIDYNSLTNPYKSLLKM